MKLTNLTRRHIRERILEHKFRGWNEKFAKRKAALAEAIYKDVFSAKERKLMASLPDGWLPEVNSIKVEFDGQGRRVRFDEPKRMPQSAAIGYDPVKSYAADHPLCRKWVALGDEEVDRQKERAELENKLNAILWSVSTTEKLVEVWPEAAPFLEKVEAAKINPPPIDVSDLNSALGLKAA